MGDPIKIRKKYNTPGHPWKKERIDFEKELIKKFALKNKKEIWRAGSVLKGFTKQAKDLIVRMGDQADKERSNLISKVKSLGLIDDNAGIDEILALTVEDVLSKRLQSVVFKKQLSKSMKQARQFIVHGHIIVNGVKITSPAYLVKVSDVVEFAQNSALADESHPERYHEEEAIKEEIKKTKKKSSDEEDDVEEKPLISPDEVKDDE